VHSLARAPVARPGQSASHAPAPLTSPCLLVSTPPPPARTLALGVDLDRRSVIGGLRTPRTPSCGIFVKENPPGFLENNPRSRFNAIRARISCREALGLYFYHRNMSNFVF
jgi:hypothetical protein